MSHNSSKLFLIQVHVYSCEKNSTENKQLRKTIQKLTNTKNNASQEIQIMRSH